MLVEGVPIREGDGLEQLRDHWREILDRGPSLSEKESAFRRYVITGLIDDLRDATDPLEQRVVASVLFEKIAELMLLTERRWIGSGKWLPRRLREFSPERSALLGGPLLAEDHPTFIERVEAELTRSGGRVQAGFVR